MSTRPTSIWIAAVSAALLGPVSSAEWTLFSPENGRFRIAAIGAPAIFPSEPGAVWSRSYAFTTEKVRFTVAYADLPAGSIRGAARDLALEQAQDGVVNDATGRLRRVDPVIISGRRGCQITIDRADGSVIVSRLVIDGDRLYQVAAKTAAAGDGLAEISEVLASFALTRAQP